MRGSERKDVLQELLPPVFILKQSLGEP